jgi:hypothetical protein
MPYLIDSDVLIDISRGKAAARAYMSMRCPRDGGSRRSPPWNSSSGHGTTETSATSMRSCQLT